MKKKCLFLFIVCLLLFNCLNVYADEQDVYFVEDAVIDDNVDYDRNAVEGFVGDGVSNIEIPEKRGIIKIHVDALKNRPKNFELYDLYFEIISVDGYGNYSVKMTAKDDYSAILEVPYGKYIFNRAGAIGDMNGNFDLTITSGPKEFTISEKENSVTLNFIGKNIISGEKNNQEILERNDKKQNRFQEMDKEQMQIIVILIVLLSIIIGFCIFFLVSMKKHDDNNE